MNLCPTCGFTLDGPLHAEATSCASWFRVALRASFDLADEKRNAHLSSCERCLEDRACLTADRLTDLLAAKLKAAVAANAMQAFG